MLRTFLLTTLALASSFASASELLQFKSAEDATVIEKKASTNTGKSTILEFDGSPTVESFVKFNVSGVNGKVVSAKLKFNVYNGSVERPAIFQSSSSWSESKINWNNRPLNISGELDGQGSIKSGGTTEYDVSEVVIKDGIYSFNLRSSSSDYGAYYSRESSKPPMLYLTVDSEPAPAPSPSPDPDPVPSLSLVNPGFESGSTGWSLKNGRIVTSGVGSGTRSVQIGTSTGYSNQDVSKNILPGATYELSALSRISSSKVMAYLGIAFKNSSGTKIAEPKAQIVSTSYGKVSLRFTAPASFASAYIFARKTTSSYYLYADNFSLIQEGIVTIPPEQPEEPQPPTEPPSDNEPKTGANLIFEESFEDGAINVAHKQFCCSYSFGVVSSPAYTGSKAGKFELRDTDAATGGGTRSEVIVMHATSHKHRWYSFAQFFPSDFVADSSSESLAQWWQKSGVTQSISLRAQNDRLLLRAGGTSSSLKTYDLGALPKNVWHDLVFHIIHSSGSDGLIEIFQNGNLIKKIVGPNMYSDAPMPNFKLGIYKASWNSGTTDTSKRTIYYDDIRVGNEKAILSDMRAK